MSLLKKNVLVQLAVGVAGIVTLGLGITMIDNLTKPEVSQPLPTVTNTPTTKPTVIVTPSPRPTPTSTITSRPTVSPTVVSPSPTAVYTPTLLAGDKGAALTPEEINYLKGINNSTVISDEDKEKLKKAPRTLIKVGKEACKYNQTLFVSAAPVAIKATKNEGFIKDFSNKPNLYTSIYNNAQTYLCKK